MDIHLPKYRCLLICTVLALYAVAGGHTHSSEDRRGPDEPMPEFSLPRGDGKVGQFESKQLIGKPSIIVFWRPNQKYSADALNDLDSLLGELEADSVHLLGVDSARSSAQEVQAVLAQSPVSFPIVLDPQRELYAALGLIVSPTTFLLDADGVIRFKVASHPRQYRQIVKARVQYLQGEISAEEMDRAIEPTVMKLDEDLAAAWRMYNLGTKLQTDGKSAQAMVVYEQAVNQYPSLSEARCALGFMRLSAGQLETASEHFRAALTYQPNLPIAKLGLAAVLVRSGQLDQAETILLALRQYDSIAVRVRYELGRIYKARGENGLAATYFADALILIFPEQIGSDTAASEPVHLDSGQATAPSEQASRESAPPSDTLPRTIAATTMPVEPVVPHADASYVGVKACKKCHIRQWKGWNDTKMARAFTVLAPSAASDVKLRQGLDPSGDYSKDPACLRCHTTGFGFPGGYAIAAADDAAALQSAQDRAGVQCEACHGPGSKYLPIHQEIQDNQRAYQQSEFYDVGQYKLGLDVCIGCHTEAAMCIAPGYIFDFDSRKEQGTHTHYELRFRRPNN